MADAAKVCAGLAGFVAGFPKKIPPNSRTEIYQPLPRGGRIENPVKASRWEGSVTGVSGGPGTAHPAVNTTARHRHDHRRLIAPLPSLRRCARRDACRLVLLRPRPETPSSPEDFDVRHHPVRVHRDDHFL